jgi:hypothetical protein
MNRTDTDIVALVAAFEAGTLAMADWHHAEHLTVALWYLRRHPREFATGLLRQNILAYVIAKGANVSGYNETLTLAWIAVVDGFRRDAEAADAGMSDAALTSALLVACGAKDHLLRFYSPERLESPEAHQGWLTPDRSALP